MAQVAFYRSSHSLGFHMPEGTMPTSCPLDIAACASCRTPVLGRRYSITGMTPSADPSRSSRAILTFLAPSWVYRLDFVIVRTNPHNRTRASR